MDESLSSPPRIERSTGPLTEPNRTVVPASQCSHCTAVTQLVVHAQNGDGTGIGELAVFVNIHGSDGRCALHVVSSTGSARGARMLIYNGADVAARTARYQPPATSTPGCFGETPLHLAVRGGHRVTCAVLIEMGSPLEQFNDLGFQPLHVAALTEVVAPPNSNDAGSIYPSMFCDSIAQLLIHSGASPWTRTFNRDCALPFELAQNGLAFDYTQWRANGEPVYRQAPRGYFPGAKSHYRSISELDLESAFSNVPGFADAPSDSQQRNDLMHNYLKDVITPGTAVFIKARAAESEQRPCFYRSSSSKSSSRDLFTDGHAKNADFAAFQMGHAVSSRFPERVRKSFHDDEISAFELWGNTYPSASAERLPTRVELDAVFASGRDHDYTRLKHLVAKLDGRVSKLHSRVAELEIEVCEANRRAKAANNDVFTASDEIDCLLAENTELRLALESGVRSHASDSGSVGSHSDSAISGDDLLSGGGGKNDATPTGGAAKQQKKREDSKKRMSKQAQKAKDLVQSGHVLTRAGISDLTKAEARAYLSAMAGSSSNGNRSVLLAAIRAAFDERGIDVFCGRAISPPL